MYIKKTLFSALLSASVLMGAAINLEAASCPVTLPYSPIFDTYYPDESGAIQHQYAWQELTGLAPSHFEVPVIEDFNVSLKPFKKYSKADTRTPIYGYHGDSKLDLNGGVKKSYTKGFRKFRVRYQGSLESKYPGDNPGETITQPLIGLTPEVIENIYKINVPYFHERGFDLQGHDTFKSLDNQFISVLSLNVDDNVAFRLIWDNDSDSKQDLKYVDLIASAQGIYNITSYEKNPSKYKSGYGYPTRIKATTNFCTFQQNVNVNPIAFYDKNEHVLTIHVPQTNGTEHFLTSFEAYTGNPDLDNVYQQYLAGFDGSFKTFKRNKNGQLVPCSLKNASVFAQVSESVSILNRFDEPGADPEFIEYSNDINSEIFDADNFSYTGYVLNELNGGTKAYDTFALPLPILNAYENIEDPLLIPKQRHRHKTYQAGDNPRTKVHDNYSGVSTITLIDNDMWNYFSIKLPLDEFKGKTLFPENVSTVAPPLAVPIEEAYITVHAHEFTHQSQISSGVEEFTPAEAMAVGIELDPHVSNGVLFPFRSAFFTSNMLDLYRGNFTAMTLTSPLFNTYGMGSWWKYMQDHFDYNNQVMRRTIDVLTNKTAGPLLEKNDFPYPYVAEVINTDGGLAALNKGLKDIFGKNIKDVWNDFSISSVLLRNNKSIPKKWRNFYPYWIYNSNYSGYAQIETANALFGFEPFSNFWEVMDTNGTVPADYSSPYTGETFIPTLPAHFEADALALTTYAFNVPLLADGGPGAIFVTVPKGEWKVTLVQFTSDGTEVGSFVADGSHSLDADGASEYIFDIAGHSPAYSETGNLRLVCVNTTFDSKGKNLADYYNAPVPNASIIIDAPVM